MNIFYGKNRYFDDLPNYSIIQNKINKKKKSDNIQSGSGNNNIKWYNRTLQNNKNKFIKIKEKKKIIENNIDINDNKEINIDNNKEININDNKVIDINDKEINYNSDDDILSELVPSDRFKYNILMNKK